MPTKSLGRGGELRLALPRMALVLAVCVVAALVATWPLALHPADAVLLGTEHEATVQVFSIWTLWWTADRLAHGLADYWNAPFFYPNPGVFTYSEPEPLTGLMVAPLWGLGVPPALIHNLALWGLLVLNGIFGYRVTRALDIPRLPALLAGVLMVTLPFIAKVWGVLNLVPIFGLLATLEGLIRFGRSGALRHAAWAGAGLVAAYLTCQQYALLFAPFALVAGGLALAQQRGQRAALLRLLGGALGVGLAILVVAWPTLTLHGQLGFTRSDALVQALSARPGDFLTRPGTATLPLPSTDPADTAGLFPGAILLALAVGGVVAAGRDPQRRRWAIYLAGMVGGSVLLALGLNLDLAGWRPFELLRGVLPGLSELRSPFRYALLGQLALPILAAWGLTAVAQRLPPCVVGLVALLGLLGAAENLNILAPTTPVPRSPRTGWTAWLAGQPPGTAVLHIPIAGGVHVSDYEIDAWRMFAQIDHHQPIVNGYSSYFPPGYTAFQAALAQEFPTADLLCTLTVGLGVHTLVVDQAWLVDHQPAMAAQAGFFQPLYRDPQVQIYHLQTPTGICQSNAPAP